MINRHRPIDIADKVMELLDVYLFRNSRKKNAVEARSLLSYLLRDKLNMRWTNIALFYENNGKRMTHANVINSYKQYKEYKRTNKKLEEVENMFTFISDLSYDEIDRLHYLEKKCKLYEEKLNNPLYKLIQDIPADKMGQAKNKILLLKKSWEWKKNL